MDNRQLLDFLQIIGRCKQNTRHNFTCPGRGESVADHSWRLATLAWLLSDELDGIDTDRVIKMCLVHDIGEAVTGDIPCFVKTESDDEHENGEVDKLVKTLPDAKSSELGGLFAEMRELKTPEAKVWRALDMLEALISHNEADISTWQPNEYALQQTYGMRQAEVDPVLKSLREQVLRDTLDKIEAAK